jgi:F0F1-type ATP synthase assembly protein I
VSGPGDGGEGEEAEKRRNARRQGLAYQGAFEAVVAILIAAGAGYWVDGRLDSSPWGLLIGTAVGFASFVLRLLRLGRQLEALGSDENGRSGKEGR